MLYLGAPSFWVDEALSVDFARLSWPQFAHLMQTRELNMLPYYLVLRAWIHLGTEEWIVRSLSAICSIATLPLFYRLGVKDVDCAFKVFKRSALEGIRLESGGAFMSAELLIKLKQRGRTIVEVGVPHYPRTAGSPTGAKPSVIFRAMRDFWKLRIGLWTNQPQALARGEPVVS
jgi:hypothetical protein